MCKCVVNGKVWFRFSSNLPRVQTINISKYLLKFTLFAKMVVWPYLQMQAKNVGKTMICSNVCSWFPRMQKSAFACGLLAFAVRSKIVNCYRFNCILNLQICNLFIHIYHGADMVTYITFALRAKLLCMMTFARHLTGVAWGKFTIPPVTLQLYSGAGFSFEAGGGQSPFHTRYFDANIRVFCFINTIFFKHLMNSLNPRITE